MSYLAAGLVQVAGVIGVVYYAASENNDLAPETTSHWEHARRGGSAGYAVMALVISSAIALAFLAMARFPQLRARRFAVPAAVVSLVSLYATFFLLTPGQ